MPAEWAPHAATWLAWPHHEPDWPGKFPPIPWVYAEIVRVLARHERVEVICHDAHARESARERLTAHGVHPDGYRLHVARTDRVWVRDSGPIGVHRGDGQVELLDFGFNAWAKYDNWKHDDEVPGHVAEWTGLPRTAVPRHDGQGPLVLEGGGIEVNGAGRIMVTEEWLLSDVQVRNPGYGRADYEREFATWLGCDETIWLGEGCVGDDTHGHIDDIARFTSVDTVVLAVERDPADDENHRRSMDNLRRLQHVGGAHGDDGRDAPPRELRQFLHRQRRRDRPHLQRCQRPARAEHAGRMFPWSRDRRHPRRRSRLGARHAPLPLPAAARAARASTLRSRASRACRRVSLVPACPVWIVARERPEGTMPP